MKFECKNCGQHLEAEENQAGRKYDCPKCGTAVVVPSTSVEHQPQAQDSLADQPAIEANIPEQDDKQECDATPTQQASVEDPSNNRPSVEASQTDSNSVSKPTSLLSDQHESAQNTESPKKRSVSLKTVLLSCWREAFDSGFVPFVVHGIRDAYKTMFDFARKPYATLVRFSDADKQEECKSLLASSVSLFIAVYWIVDKIVGSYSDVFQKILDDRLDSGRYLSSDLGEEGAFQMTQTAKQFAELLGVMTQRLELTTVFLLLALIFTTYYLFQRKSKIDTSFHDEDTSRFIRPTLLFACGNGMIISLFILVSPLLMIFAYLGIFGILVITVYFALIGVFSYYILWGYMKWLSHYFDVTKKRAIITYMVIGFVFNITVQIIHFIVVIGPVMAVDKLLG